MCAVPVRFHPARRQLAEPGTPFGELEDEDGRLLAQFAMRAKMSPVRSADVSAQDVHRVVIQDFLACVEDEVEVRRGDCVRELFRDGDWMFVATTAGQTGFIPASYCRPISALINLPKGSSSSISSVSSNRPSADSGSPVSMGLANSSSSRSSVISASSSLAVSDSSPNGSVRRRSGASQSTSRLATHGPGIHGGDSYAYWNGRNGTDTTDSSRAPSRSLGARHRVSLLAALGDDELARQRIGLQEASGLDAGSGSNCPSGPTSPESNGSSQLNSPSRLSRRYSLYDSSPSSPSKSIDSVSILSNSPRKSSAPVPSQYQHSPDHSMASPSPQCRRRVTNRGRQSRRTSADMDRNSPQPSISSLPAVVKKVRLAYNFQANKEGELSLSNGDEVAVIQEQSKDWLLVETEDGRQGLVPTCLTITVSAVHAPGHNSKSRSSATLNIKRAGGGGSDGDKPQATAAMMSSDSCSDSTDGSRNARTLTNRPSGGSSAAATKIGNGDVFANSPANITGLSHLSQEDDDDRSATLTRANVSQLQGNQTLQHHQTRYEDLYNFAHDSHQQQHPQQQQQRAETAHGHRTGSSPTRLGTKRRSHSASRTTLHRITVDESVRAVSPGHNSDGETGSSRTSSISKFFGRGKSRKSSNTPSSQQPANGNGSGSSSAAGGGGGNGGSDRDSLREPVVYSAGQDADHLAHAWRNNQPAYHRQRSRSSSRTGIHRIDNSSAVIADTSVTPQSTANHSVSAVSTTIVTNVASSGVTTDKSVTASPKSGTTCVTALSKPIPVGNAAVFTTSQSVEHHRYENEVEIAKHHGRSATLQPGTRPPTAPATPKHQRSVVHTRAPSLAGDMPPSPSLSSPSPRPPETQQRQLRVLFNYTAMVAEELNVHSGDVLAEVPSKSKPGWAWVTEPGTKRQGYIPVGFTETYVPPPPPRKPSTGSSSNMPAKTTTTTTSGITCTQDAVAQVNQVAAQFHKQTSGELCTTI
eukprot:scpid11605/ scgid7131/ 